MPRRPVDLAVTAIALAMALSLVIVTPGGAADVQTAPPVRPIEGFGADTRGGTGGAEYVVTSLDDAGPGTLREALSGSERSIRFAVSGTIRVATTLAVRGSHLTVDASTAPPPGITITAAAPTFTGPLFEIDGDDGAHDVILRHLRLRDNPDPRTGDILRIEDRAHHVVVDHCSFRRAGDGALDLSAGVHDVTVQWSIIAETSKAQLIRTGVRNLSLHHNLYVECDERNPQVQEAPGPIDFVNNVVFGWGSNYGMRIRGGTSANLVGNWFLPGPGSDAADALHILPDVAGVYLDDNRLPASCHVSGSTGTQLVVPPVTRLPSAAALNAVLAEAGAFPRDEDDAEYISHVAALVPMDLGPRSR